MTSEPRFIQIHTLHGYSAALLNRDDAGLAKRLPFGNATRTRISSQCLKRHWRVTDDPFALSRLGVPMAVRSRVFSDQIEGILLAEGVSPEVAADLAGALRDSFKKDLKKLIKAEGSKKTGKKTKKAADEDDSGEEVSSGPQKQAILLGTSEFDYLKKICLSVAAGLPADTPARLALLERLQSERENFEAMKLGSGLESALFGRMVTSDVLASRDAAVYVAHAFTVHGAQVENDYFTVVDDLTREAGELGSAGIFDTELASGLYYGYVVVDVRQLVANLEGIGLDACFAADTPAERRALAARVVRHLLHLIATVSPGAKRGSTAPFDWASLMLVEAGDWQPRNLSGAFLDALPLASTEGPIRQRAAERLFGEIERLDRAYGATLVRGLMSLDELALAGAEPMSLPDLADWTAGLIEQGSC